MAVRSIVDIDLSSIDKFSALFNKYYDQLGKTGKMWDEIGGEAKGTGATFKEMSAALLAQNQISTQLSGNLDKSGKASAALSGSWRDMAKTTKTVAGNIVEATKSILRWASITGIISGLIGAGGLFGIDRLAISAGNSRRSALGLGTTVGEQKAFALNFGRLFDPGAFLGGVNEALHDVTKRPALYAAGLSEAQIRGKDSSEVAAELIPVLKKLADQTPAEMLGQVLQARHLDQFITLEDFQRLKGTSSNEIRDYLRTYRNDTTTLNLTRSQQKAWQDLQVQLSRAGESIETTFIRGLTPLAPQIVRLSDAVTKLIRDFFETKTAKQWIDDLADGVKWLDKEITRPEFKTGVEAFARNIGAAAVGLAHFIEALASFFGGKSDPSGAWSRKSAVPTHGPLGGDNAENNRRTHDQWLKDHQKEGQLFPPNTRTEAEREKSNLLLRWWNELKRRWESDPPKVQIEPPAFSPMGYQVTPSETQRGLIQLANFVQPGGGGYSPVSFSPLTGLPSADDIVGSGGGVPSSPLKSDNAKIAHDFFRAHGWSEAQTAGLLANAQNESGFDPHRVNQRGGDAGLFQWRGVRAREFEEMFHHKVQQGTLAEQLAFAQWELTQGPEKSVGEQLKRIMEAGQAGWFITKRFERPDPNRVDIIAQQRAALARQWMQRVPRVDIQVHNNTGGNAIVTAAAMAIA